MPGPSVGATLGSTFGGGDLSRCGPLWITSTHLPDGDVFDDGYLGPVAEVLPANCALATAPRTTPTPSGTPNLTTANRTAPSMQHARTAFGADERVR